jgi:cardiolipin synthase
MVAHRLCDAPAGTAPPPVLDGRRWPLRAGVLGLCLLLGGCARLPDLHYLKEPLNVPVTPQVVGGQGPLNTKEAAKVLGKAGYAKPDARALAALEEAATGRPLIEGNKVTLLFDGPRTIAAMTAAVAAAKDSINLETYLFDQDPLGMKFAEQLISKQKQGVQVNIIYDCLGTLGTPQAFFDRLQAAGIRLLPFQPVSPMHRLWRWRLNNRDHRKILVVDGKVAFAGGVNITAAYLSSSLFRAHSRRSAAIGWRDTHLQIEGPAVAALQWLFLDNWSSQKEGEVPDRAYYPDLAKTGDKVLRVLSSQPGSNHEIFKAYYLAMEGASRSIHITAAYFVPDGQILKSLMAAAKRGVDVKLILPNKSDSWLATQAGHSFYTRMFAAGIRIFELRTAVLHAKTAVIDGNWSTVGSTNMDMRSFLHNKEVNVVVVGDGFGKEMEAAFQDDLKDSDEVTAGRWAHRTAGQRCKEWLARLLAYWL